MKGSGTLDVDKKELRHVVLGSTSSFSKSTGSKRRLGRLKSKADRLCGLVVRVPGY
jgi:hypothetical protein